MTAWSFFCSRRSSLASRPPGPSSANGSSGTRQKFTSWLATVAAAAMKPAWRPISLTSETPFSTLRASVWALSITCTASSTAVSKPKVRVTIAHVVVDRLRDADHRERVALAPRLLEERVAAALRAVAADGEEDVDAAG